MLPGKQFSPADIWPILRRRRWLIIVPAFVGAFTALLVSRVLPNRYASETLIQIVGQSVPDEYVRTTVTTAIDERLKTISQQIMSRTRLEQLVVELNLYPEERRAEPMDDVVARMRAAIGLQIAPPVRTPRGWGEPDSFRLRFTYDDAETARRVTERLAGLFISENTRIRGQQAESTNVFMESQLKDARSRLEEQEKKLEAFSRQHSGRLPSQMQSNMQAIQSTQLQLQALVSSLEADRGRKMIVERLYSDAQSDLRRLADAPLPPAPSGQSEAALAAATPRQQLETARQHLTQLEQRLTPEHPDIRATKRRIADLEKVVAAAPPPGEAPAPRPSSPDESQRRERVSSLRAELDGLGRTIAFKEREEQRLRQQVGDYQGRIESVPGLESEFIKLSRDYDTLNENYKALLTKSESSKVAVNLEHQVGEQFQVLDPASAPSRPESPQRLLINAGGVLLGLLLGLAIAGLLEFMDTTYHTESDVVTALSLPVLAVVPALQTPADLREARRRRLLAAVAVGVVLIACTGLGVALQLWRYVL